MAGFVTANRWATGVETHKTSDGRILCTGVGCVGCFPDVFSTEASELGVCDVDLTGSILGLRSFLDEENSRENAKNFSKKQTRVKSRKRRRRRTIDKERDSSADDTKGQAESNKSAAKSEESCRPSKESINTVSTQTELSDLGIDAERVLLENSTDGCKQDLLTFEEESKANKEGIPSGNERQSTDNCSIVHVDDTVNKPNRNSQGLFDQQSPGSRFEKIHDKMYIVSGKDIALSSCDNLMREDDFFENIQDGTRVTKQHHSSRGEDAVCFFFALEYYNSQRILPHFRVMEIVEALSTVVDLKDIKCVQRISRRWHIVLKSRKYVGLLRNSGLKLRGRVYQLIDDVDSYFDVVG